MGAELPISSLGLWDLGGCAQPWRLTRRPTLSLPSRLGSLTEGRWRPVCLGDPTGLSCVSDIPTWLLCGHLTGWGTRASHIPASRVGPEAPGCAAPRWHTWFDLGARLRPCSSSSLSASLLRTGAGALCHTARVPLQVSAGAPSFHLGTHCRWNSPSPRDGPQGNPQRD